MHKILWPVIAVVLVAGGGAFWALKSNTQYKPVLPGGVPRDTTREELEAMMAQWRDEITPPPRAGSEAVAPEMEHDFGMLDPGLAGAHRFAIRNEGTETLLLGDPKSDSDYIEGEFTKRQIEPGGAGELIVRWQPVHVQSGTYRGAVTLPTSDPRHALLRFQIRGEIVQRLAAIPASLNFGDIDPRESPGTLEAVIGSQVWESFEILESTCEMEGVRWEFGPASPADLARHQFKGACRVRVAMPNTLAQGRNVTHLQMTIQPPVDGAEPIECQLRLAARVLRTLCFYGDEIDRDGLVNMGLVQSGRGKSLALRVKVRDEVTELPGVRLQTSPSLVQAELTPIEAGGVAGNYLLTITIPPDAPLCTHILPGERGTIRILTDHPRAAEQTLSLRFAVAGDGD